ncbi:hypothetical protein D3C71_1632540 [compost metagenome]
MHPVAVTHAFGRLGRHRLGGELAAAVVAVGEVFEDRAGFGQHQGIVLQHRRFSQRVHVAQRLRRQPGLGIALVVDDLVRQAQFFEHPQHAQRARVVQMVHLDHRGFRRVKAAS